MTLPSEANFQFRGKYISLPTTPYKFRARFWMGPGVGTLGSSSTIVALAFRQSSTSKLVMGAARGGQNAAMWRFTNNTTFSATVDSSAIQQWHGDRIWIYGHDDGTNIKFRFSWDGNNWTREGTSWFEEGRTAFMTGGPDQIGFCASSGSGLAGCHIKLDTFVIEEL
jgi:hypothetical protein